MVWWRRIKSSQNISSAYPEDQRKVIDKDCQASLVGAFLTAFSGKWISHPWFTEQAGNKLYQFSIAKQAGFKVPRTIVSQYPDEVRRFCKLNEQGTIIKRVSGGYTDPVLFTEFVSAQHLAYADESISVSPTIYQEYVPGKTHIRLNCFGDKSYAAIIETSDLDWRQNLNVPIASWTVPVPLHRKVRRVLDELHLEMGIIDLKLSNDGSIWWFEVNPQGQFLFLEPLTGNPYRKIFSDYLRHEANVYLPRHEQ